MLPVTHEEILASITQINRLNETFSADNQVTQGAVNTLLHSIRVTLLGDNKAGECKEASELPAKLTKRQGDVLLDLARACLNYLSYHMDPKRMVLYRVFSTHGKAGRARAVDFLNRLQDVTNNINTITDAQLRSLRDTFLREASPIFPGEHSLHTYLDGTMRITNFPKLARS